MHTASRLIWLPLVAVAVGSLMSCASTRLPYTPDQQPEGARIAAAYRVVGDRLRVEIDTDGHRLEEIKIVKADGTELHAQTIERPSATAAGSPVSVGIGVGGGTWGSRGGVGVGTGVGVGVPVGGSRVEGHTFAYFPLDQAGPAPWRLRVKLVGIQPALIVVGQEVH
jgi:hypothetical protein